MSCIQGLLLKLLPHACMEDVFFAEKHQDYLKNALFHNKFKLFNEPCYLGVGHVMMKRDDVILLFQKISGTCHGVGHVI